MAVAYFIGIIFFLVLIVAFLNRMPGGCGGNCKQGRTKCDCKNIF
jgi:hypothetical protein